MLKTEPCYYEMNKVILDPITESEIVSKMSINATIGIQVSRTPRDRKADKIPGCQTEGTQVERKYPPLRLVLSGPLSFRW